MGYEVTRFLNAENIEDFLCLICHEVLEEPVLINCCEHMFCYRCITLWTDRNSSCPVDRLQIRKSDFGNQSRFFRNQYNRLQMSCKFSENGCKSIVQMATILSHEGACPFNPNKIDRNNIKLSQQIVQMTSNVSAGQKALVDSLKSNGRIQSEDVYRTMLAVDRILFCTTKHYEDQAINISYGSTISAPHMHAKILDLLKTNLKPHAKVLDIGSGSGYLTICMALMLKGNGKVIGIDHVSQLVHRSRNIIVQHCGNSLQSEIEFVCGDGRAGYPTEGPYDAINIGGALNEVPQIIIDQLKPNGRIVVPLTNGPTRQTLFTIDKSDTDGTITRQRHGSVRFKRITDLESQLLL